MIPDPGEILYPAAANQHNRVFLQIVAYAGNIGGNFRTVGKPYTGNLAEGGIRLFGGNGHHPRANPALLGAGMQRGRLRFRANLLSSGAHQLIDSRHAFKTPKNLFARQCGQAPQHTARKTKKIPYSGSIILSEIKKKVNSFIMEL
jgi:hypothetical protein